MIRVDVVISMARKPHASCLGLVSVAPRMGTSSGQDSSFFFLLVEGGWGLQLVERRLSEVSQLGSCGDAVLHRYCGTVQRFSDSGTLQSWCLLPALATLHCGMRCVVDGGDKRMKVTDVGIVGQVRDSLYSRALDCSRVVYYEGGLHQPFAFRQ